MKSVGIVVCNYNKRDMALSCIAHILEQSYTDYELFVVDNASTDGSAEAIREAYGGRLTLLCNAENLGGSGGFNTGLRAAYAKGFPYLMCVDNDAMLDKDAVGELVRFLEDHNECGMAASKIYHLEKPDYVQNFGQRIDFDYYCTEVDDLNRFEDGTMPPYVYTDGVPACSLLVRRKTVDRIGFLPEENFLYWDDTEWCLLCNRMGLKVASVGASKAYHAMGAKKEDVNTFPTYYAWRNWISFFIKYTPEEKYIDMAMQFLSSVYETQFVGWYNDVYNKANTVMAAYDDAVHGIVGKAGEGRIFPIDLPEKHYEDFFSSHRVITIIQNGYLELTEHIKRTAERFKAGDITFSAFSDANKWKKDAKEAVGRRDADARGMTENTLVYLCQGFLHENVSAIGLPEEADVWLWDVDDCIVPLEEQPRLLDDFIKGRELFIFSHLPLFLRETECLRK